MSRWFRMYDTLLDDPKVQKLEPRLFKAWVNLLCVASRNAGTIPPIDAAFALRVSEKDAAKILVALVAAGLVDNDGVLTPHNWSSRQYQSDTSAERMRRHRKRNSDDDVTSHVTPPETEADTESETERKKSRETEAPEAPVSELDLAFDEWNSLAEETGLPKAQAFTARRRSALKQRLASCGGLDGWRSALAKIRGSPGLRGADGGWKADLDFVLQESSFVKLMEGKYDGWGTGNAAKPSGLDNGYAKLVAGASG